jgi:hypothetical protein
MRPLILNLLGTRLLWHWHRRSKMRAIEKEHVEAGEIDVALAWHAGDARATIATLIADCSYLRQQIALVDRAVSRGFVRGWTPKVDRPADETLAREV